MGFWDELFDRFRTRPALPAPPESRFADAQRMDSGSSILNLRTGVGGPGDKGSTSRPNPLVIPLSERELEALWNYNAIARKLVKIFPDRATREGWEVPDIPESENKRLRVRGNVREGMTWAQLYGGSGVLMVTEDDVPAMYGGNPREWLKQPLQLHRVGRLHALQVFDVYGATPNQWDTNIRSTNYRMPLTWDISDDGFSAEVHYTRMLHFRGPKRPPSWRRYGFRTSYLNFPDVSFLQHIWDQIRNFCDTMNGGAAVAQELRHAVLKVGDFHSAMTDAQATKFQERMGLFQQLLSSIGIALLGPNDDFQQRSTPPSGFMELSDAAMRVLSAAANIPEQEFWGSTPGGLNTDGASGKEGFRATISDFQEDNRHPLEKLYRVMYSAQDGPTRGVEPEEWELKYRPLDEPSELTQAQLRQVVADTDATLIDSGMVTPEHVRRHRYGIDGWKFDIPGMTEEEMAELEFEDDARREMMQVQREQTMMGGGGGPNEVSGSSGGSPPAPPDGPRPSGANPDSRALG